MRSYRTRSNLCLGLSIERLVQGAFHYLQHNLVLVALQFMLVNLDYVVQILPCIIAHDGFFLD